MSIAFETSSRIEGRTKFNRGLSFKSSNFDSTNKKFSNSSSSMAGISPENRRRPGIMEIGDLKDLNDDGGDGEGSCSSSSIGRNSDSSGKVETDGEDESEVQSCYKGPLDTMDALEEVLPIRRGISKFYSGKSKSFTSLADASASSSVKDLAKPDDAYTRKRKNLLACNNILGDRKNRSHNNLRKSDVGFGFGGGISSSKRLTNSNRRTTFPISLTTSSSESNNTSENSNSNSNTLSSSPPMLRPPLHPPAKSSLNNASSSSSQATPPPPRRNSAFSPWRSFSLTDLQHAAADASDSNRPGKLYNHQ